MSICPDRQHMKNDKTWKYFKTIKNFRCNISDFDMASISADIEVLALMEDVRQKTGQLAWCEPVKFNRINAQVCLVDLKVYIKPIEKTVYSVKASKKSCHMARADKYEVTFIDEDGDTSEETFEGSENGLVEVLYRNYHKFGLKLHSLKRNGQKVNTQNGCFEIDHYRFSIA